MPAPTSSHTDAEQHGGQEIEDARVQRSRHWYQDGPLLKLLLMFAAVIISPFGFGILLWALIAFAQNGSSRAIDCAYREKQNGFLGNSDFYGLGIRLGVYLQWWASLGANVFLPGESTAMFVGYLGFSVALIIAVVIVTFQHFCTFTAEIIVVLYMYWAGFITTAYTMTAVVGAAAQTFNDAWGSGLMVVFTTSAWISVTYTAWFWLRLSTTGEMDFRNTPEGTSYFLVTRISPHSKAAVGFITSMCLLYGLNLFVSWSYIIVSTIRVLISRIKPSRRAPSPAPTERTSSIRTASPDIGERDSSMRIKRMRFTAGFGCLGASILIYSTVGIELTLVWNSISGVYSLDSTGQIIPLIVGLGLFVNTIWKLSKQFTPSSESLYSDSSYSWSSHELQDLRAEQSLLVAFQNDDGTWK